DVVEVKDGYGRNYLLPQRFAIPWSKGGEKQITLIKRARSAREIRDLGHANEVRARLEGLKVSLTARAGAGGRLFGSVTTGEVVGTGWSAGEPVTCSARAATSGLSSPAISTSRPRSKRQSPLPAMSEATSDTVYGNRSAGSARRYPATCSKYDRMLSSVCP